jgi:hypothetical protein
LARAAASPFLMTATTSQQRDAVTWPQRAASQAAVCCGAVLSGVHAIEADI